jgi:two-component system, cell cycle response regulator DivK
MDLRLPGMDGLTLTRTLRADPANHGITIVAFSAEPTPKKSNVRRAAGCGGYITKPIDTRSFAATVRGHLASRSSALSDNRRHES